MLRTSFLRAARSTCSPVFPSTASRQTVHFPKAVSAICVHQQHVRQAHAISNPTLVDIEKRWESMPPQEQAELWMALRDRMKADWHELTMQEKKAAYWIAFGPHGPRALPPPDENRKVFSLVAIGLAVSAVLFAATRWGAGPAPKTMTKEWQEATEEYLKEQGTEPITSHKGFMVQSKPAKKD